jgi:ubiquinone/menaquinone biosynthesis C-methylase UbiE
LLDFTGERVIPGLVDPNLFNEHMARYRFAARFAAGAVVLDAGCGSGYGSAELSSLTGHAASVVGVDLSAEAVRHATNTFGGPGVRFLQARCEALPFADGAFDLVVAFEVIEHLEKWREMLAEARRVLRPAGMLLVSTPNKAYYAETRAAAGPNPFHVHEFECSEFRAALTEVFPHVHLWSQNHSETIAFVPKEPSRGALDAPGDADPGNAHFFLAACSQSRIADTGAFAWLPEAGNALREREQHIALLETELRQKTDWLKQSGDNLAALQQAHENLLAELHRQNEWAEQLNGDLEKAGERIGELQEEAVVRLAWVRDLESQLVRGRQEIERLNAENESYYASILDSNRNVESLKQELERENAELRRTKAEVNSLETEIQRMEAEHEPIEVENGWLRAERRKIAQSKWLRLGRALGFGPVVKSD